LGPIISPCRQGVSYVSGTFHTPPTLLHVSRGISSLDPLRINCLPELTRVVLRVAQPRRVVPEIPREEPVSAV
jgi:hypothetical protein